MFPLNGLYLFFLSCLCSCFASLCLVLASCQVWLHLLFVHIVAARHKSQESQCSKSANFMTVGGMNGEQNTARKHRHTHTVVYSCCVVFGSLRSCSMCSNRKVCEIDTSRATTGKHRGREEWKATKQIYTHYTTNPDITTRPPTSHVQVAGSQSHWHVFSWME